MSYLKVQQEIIRTVRILAGKNIPVYLEGFAPRVEYDVKTKKPVRVFLPIIPKDYSPDLISAIHGYLDHECSHILLSDSDDVTNTEKSKLWHYIHNCIEDPRVNREMSKMFPGSKINIRRGYQYLFNKFKDDKGNLLYSIEYIDGLDLSTPEELARFQLNFSSLWFAGLMGCSLSRGKYNELHLDRFYEDLIEKADTDRITQLNNIKTAAEVRDAADYWTNFFIEELLDDKSRSKGDKTFSDKWDDVTPDTMEDRLAKTIEKEAEEGASTGKSHYYWTDRFDKVLNKFDIEKEIAAYGGSAYSPRSEIDVVAFEEETKTISNFLTKDLRRMLEERLRKYYVGGYKSGKLNGRSLFSVRLGNDRVFKKKNHIREINGAVSLLIDMSGSMNGSKIKTAMQSAYAMAMVLDQLKVPYEISGFVTDTMSYSMEEAFREFRAKNPKTAHRVVNPSSPEKIYIFKGFNEKFDYVAKRNITAAALGYIPMKQNEDSKHVALAIERLGDRSEPIKSLFVFSDGEPYFCSSNTNSRSKLKSVIANAMEDFGVEVYGIGIQTEAVRTFYPKYKVIHNLKELPSTLFDFLRKVFG